MPLIGAVADDLTGATTTGVLLARSKARTAVFFNEEVSFLQLQQYCSSFYSIFSFQRRKEMLWALQLVPQPSIQL